MKEFSEHLAVLALVLAFGFFGLAYFRSTPLIQQSIAWGMIGLYVLWGVVHHLIRKDLTSAIVLEYILCGLLAGIVINSLIH